MYATSISYKCPLAWEFVVEDSNDTVPFHNMTCGWDGRWNNTNNYTQCIRKGEKSMKPAT